MIKTNKSFGEVIEALKEGKMATRIGWNGKGLFVFMQIPSTINKDTVPKMQSLPQSVKDEFEKRFKDPNNTQKIYYINQLALVDQSNTIHGWVPSVSDVLADDWEILQ